MGDVLDAPHAAPDLLVVGGPTHVHSLSTERTRKAASDAAVKPSSGLILEPSATGPGVREWLARIGDGRGGAAASEPPRARTTEALAPPNAKLFEIATSMDKGRAVLGT